MTDGAVKASRAICESHRPPGPISALANLLGKQIVNFDEDPPPPAGSEDRIVRYGW